MLKTKSSFHTLPLIPAAKKLLLDEKSKQEMYRRLFKKSYCSNGISVKQIQIWLGHSTFATTADIYARLDFSAQEQSAAAVGSMFQRGETAPA